VTFSELRETCELDNRELRSFLHHALVCRLQSERRCEYACRCGSSHDPAHREHGCPRCPKPWPVQLQLEEAA
jgi:hypothetical protein